MDGAAAGSSEAIRVGNRDDIGFRLVGPMCFGSQISYFVCSLEGWISLSRSFKRLGWETEQPMVSAVCLAVISYLS